MARGLAWMVQERMEISLNGRFLSSTLLFSITSNVSNPSIILQKHNKHLLIISYEHFLMFQKLSKDGVLVVKMRLTIINEKKLRSIRIPALVSHTEPPSSIMSQV